MIGMKSVAVMMGIWLVLAAAETAATPAWAADMPTSSSTEAVPDIEKPVFAALQATIAAAQKDGFKLVMLDAIPSKSIIEIEFAKNGKTLDGYGLLGVKWDEKKTIKIKLARNGGEVSLIDASQKIQVKPPIGEWKTQAGDETPLPSWSRPGS